MKLRKSVAVFLSLIVLLCIGYIIYKSVVQGNYDKLFSQEFTESIVKVEYAPNDTTYVVEDKESIQKIMDIFSQQEVCLCTKRESVDGGFSLTVYTDDSEYHIGESGVWIWAYDGNQYRMVSDDNIADKVREIILKDK